MWEESCIKCGWKPKPSTMPPPEGQGHPRAPAVGGLTPVIYPTTLSHGYYECIDEAACIVRRVVAEQPLPLMGLNPNPWCELLEC